jgi:uncharacterized protein YjbJ (UPF0337 family)
MAHVDRFRLNSLENATKNSADKPARKERFSAPKIGSASNRSEQGDRFMGSVADKVKGNANEAMGKAKQGVGEAVGSDRLQGEGAVQEVKGKGQKALGDAKEATKDAVNKAAAAANRKL